jgi:hypothetical protein
MEQLDQRSRLVVQALVLPLVVAVDICLTHGSIKVAVGKVSQTRAPRLYPRPARRSMGAKGEGTR